jgi:uncharacterized protein (TIGR02598 family)
MKSRRFSRSGGFALAEIAIAIGITAFALVGIMSMLSIGMTSSRESTQDTVIATMATAVISQLRATNSSTTNFDSLTGSRSFYFDANGGGWTTMGPGSSSSAFGGSNASSIYQCQVDFLDSFAATTASTNVKMARLTFTWPVQAPLNKRSTNIIHATLTPY